jgi:hypothetical protein
LFRSHVPWSQFISRINRGPKRARISNKKAVEVDENCDPMNDRNRASPKHSPCASGIRAVARLVPPLPRLAHVGPHVQRPSFMQEVWVNARRA